MRYRQGIFTVGSAHLNSHALGDFLTQPDTILDDVCVSGVFGAGKTRAAAALIAGLMVMDPSLNLMVMSKENTAAKAFTDHLLSLQLPQSVYDRAGRIVGYLETKKGASHKTKLDIEQEKRNDVLRGKKLLIGCGGGFQQESQQRYSPVRQWISTIHLALMDEAQQYGNIDELATLARAPNHCLVLWCGDHKQTPGGLRNTTEAKMFRRKLLSRPLGLRCDSLTYSARLWPNSWWEQREAWLIAGLLS